MEISESNGRSDVKTVLLKCIDEIPGIRYRELLRLTGISNGVLKYHLDFLEKSKALQVYRQNKMTRFYPINVPLEEFDVIRYMRNRTTRQIITFLLEHESCTFNEIVEHTKKASSTVSWNLKRLKNSGLITVHYGESQLYMLTNRRIVIDVLSKYRESFVDKVVDNYIEMTEEL